MVSPSGVAAAAVAGGVTLVAGLPVAVAVGAAAAGWSARVVFAAIKGPRAPRRTPIDPFGVGEPWRGHVVSARKSQRRFNEAVAGVPPGPLRDRLEATRARVDGAVDEMWRIAQSGHALTVARRQIDDRSARRTLAAEGPEPGTPATEALQAQLDAADRLDSSIADTRDHLGVLDAQLAAATTRAVELAAHHAAGTAGGLDADLRALTDEMEALRLALEETGPQPPPQLPPPVPPSEPPPTETP